MKLRLICIASVVSLLGVQQDIECSNSGAVTCKELKKLPVHKRLKHQWAKKEKIKQEFAPLIKELKKESQVATDDFRALLYNKNNQQFFLKNSELIEVQPGTPYFKFRVLGALREQLGGKDGVINISLRSLIEKENAQLFSAMFCANKEKFKGQGSIKVNGKTQDGRIACIQLKDKNPDVNISSILKSSSESGTEEGWVFEYCLYKE